MTHIAIVGAGPAGSVAASLLAQRGYDVSLIYRDPPEGYKAGETISPHGNDVFSRLGLEPLFASGEHVPCPGNQSAFGSDGLYDVDFLYSTHGLGWHLDRLKFERQLINKAMQDGVRLFSGKSLESIERKELGWELVIADQLEQRTLQSDYLIDASGRNRVVLRKLGIPINKLDQLAARTAVFTLTEQTSDRRTMIEAAEDGWWYSTVLTGARRVVMFFGDAGDDQFRSCGNQRFFLNSLRLTAHVWPKLESELNATGSMMGPTLRSCERDAIKAIAEFSTKPVSTSWSHRIQGSRWIAIGDAAMTFDPLSSQGIYTALCSAEKAVDQIQALTKRSSLGRDVRHSDYVDWAESQFSQYISERTKYYKMEQRWADRRFWLSRHSMPMMAAI